MLHVTHPGMVQMKALARSYIWWPGIDSEIEQKVRECTKCQETQNMPPKAPLHPWEWTTEPWSRIHIDHAGPFHGKIFLIVVDAYSKWLEVREVPTTSTAATVKVLRELFATHGIPKVIVSDNGTSFTSTEFSEFAKGNGIRHARIAPYHPSANGQAERMVQLTKKKLSKLVEGDWATKISRFLLTQHITPTTTTGFSPAQLLMKRRLRSCLDLLHPDSLPDKVEKKMDKWMNQNGKEARKFEEQEEVYSRNYGLGPKWVPVVVTRQTGPVSYETVDEAGETQKRHVDQLRSKLTTEPDEPIGQEETAEQRAESDSSNVDTELELRRSTRQRKLPTHLQDFQL